MRTRTISIRDLSQSDLEAWRDLAARSVEPNPFYEVDFLVPACRYLRDGKRVVLLVAEHAGRFHACVPLRRLPLPGILAPAISSWRHLYSFLGTPLVAPERGVEAVSSLLTALRGTGVWRRVVVLELFGDDGPIASYFRRAAEELRLNVHVHTAWERAIFRCQGDKTDELPPSVRRERRAKARGWRRLTGDWGTPTVVDRAQDGDGATDFLAVEASGWKGRAGTAMACRAKDAAFYREVTSRFGATGRLRLYSLEVGGQTLAMQTNFYTGSALFDWKVAYDERFAQYGPGTQLQLRVIDLARREGVHWIDSCSDAEDERQLRLSAERRRIATLAIGGCGRLRGPRFTMAVLILRASRRLRGISASALRSQLAEASRAVRRIFER